MKSLTNWHTYQTWASDAHTPRQMVNLAWSETLHDLWQRVAAHLSVSSEPHVWQTQNDAGQTVWSAYDPSNGREIHGVSESEMRIWLEERHYHDRFITNQKAQQLRAEQLYQR
ncbi:MAG: hypothetical protein ACFE0I_20615 [Elainellaceae cyanobacterium]